MNDQKLQEIHANLGNAETHLRELARRVKQDSKGGESPCRNFADWAATPPDTQLDRARRRLDQEYYRVGIAGLFSSGKSTIINALVDDPDLLPTASHVCTLTRTILRAPEEGTDERVEVQYWTQDEAIRNAIRNPKFEDVFEADDKQRAENGTVGVQDVQNAIARCSEGDREQQALASELREFVDALGIHEAKLGRVHRVPISEKDQYLRTTAVEEDGVTRLVGIGHIRCIAHAIIYLRNPLFTQEHIELMDLPGTDDPDPTQKQITYDALKTIDVLISAVFGSRGLNEEDLSILDEMVNHHKAVTEKTFFAANRMDDLLPNDITNASLEGLVSDGLLKHLTQRGFDATRVYLVSARYAELLSKEKQRLPMSDAEQGSLDALRLKCDQLGAKLGADIRPDLKDRLGAAYTDGGVSRLREDLIDYLKHDIKTTHFKEVQSDLTDVAKNLDRMLEPERGDSWDLNADESALDAFVDDATDAFESILYTFEDKMEGIFPQLIVKLREYTEENVRNLISRDNKALNFKKIRSSLATPGTYQIKSAVIVQAREEIGNAITNLVSVQLAKTVASQVVGKLNDLQPKEAFAALDEQLETDLAPRYDALVKAFEEGLRRASQLRIHEEVAAMKQEIPDPRPGGGDWSDEVEANFREELIKLFNEKLANRLGRFDKVLPVHFRLISGELREGLKGLTDELSKAGRHREDVDIPTLAGTELDPAEVKRRALKGYLRSYDIAKEALDAASGELRSLSS